MRTHWIRERGATRFSASATHCGLTGWQGEHSDVEFTTVQGSIFEASEKLSAVDCARCLASAKRISETCQTPRGNRRRVKA